VASDEEQVSLAVRFDPFVSSRVNLSQGYLTGHSAIAAHGH
jgi:hypothetical protein